MTASEIWIAKDDGSDIVRAAYLGSEGVDGVDDMAADTIAVEPA